jgi:hypothetical protein
MENASKVVKLDVHESKVTNMSLKLGGFGRWSADDGVEEQD